MTNSAHVQSWRFGRLVKIGMGNRPWLEIEQTGAALTARERRETARAIRRGQPATDARTARYAVALTPLYAAAGDWYSSSRIRAIYGGIALLQLLNAVLHAVDGSWPSAALFALCAVVFGFVAARPQPHGRAREALAENLRLAGMPGDEAPALTPVRPSRPELIAGLAVSFVGFALLSAGGVAVGAAGSVSAVTILAIGAGTSAVLLALIWLFGRALRRNWMTPGAVRAVTHPTG